MTNRPSTNPDDSTEVHLEEVEAAKATAQVALSRENAVKLIDAIQSLGKSNLRLAEEFRSVKRLIYVMLAVLALVVLVLGVVVWWMGGLHSTMVHVSETQHANVDAVAQVISAMKDLTQATEETQTDLAEIPRIEIKAPSPADPTGHPVAVVVPGKVPSAATGGMKAPPAPPVEIPLSSAK